MTRGEWVDGGNAVMDGTHWVWTPNPALVPEVGNSALTLAAAGVMNLPWILIFLRPRRQKLLMPGTILVYILACLGNGAITGWTKMLDLHGRAESNSIVYIHNR